MNKNNIQLLVVLFFTVVGIWSCEDYLDIVPKGKKVPKSLDDYAAFLQNPYLTVLGADYFKRYMVNEFYQDPAYIRTNPLNEIHFYWREDLDRIGIYESDGSYTGNYRAIFYMNLIINDVPSISVSTDEERKRARSLVAQAKVCRALHYFHLVKICSAKCWKK